jgi:hypothetical protein
LYKFAWVYYIHIYSCIMYRIILILLLFPLALFSQVNPLHDYDVPQALISQTSVLTGQDFRDYLKGSGDIFLEYGFRSLLVQDLRWKTEHVILEAYEMIDPTSAYGIYSVSVDGCFPKDSLTSFDCFSRAGYQAAFGRFYLKITTDAPSPGDKEFFSILTKKFMSNNHDTLLLLPSVFLQDLILRFGRDPYCTKGVLGVKHSPVPWQDLFTMVRNTMFVIILPFERDVYFARISFTAESDKLTFLQRAGLMNGFNPVPNTTTPDGLYREFRQIDDKNIYFLECQLPFPISSLVP